MSPPTDPAGASRVRAARHWPAPPVGVSLAQRPERKLALVGLARRRLP